MYDAIIAGAGPAGCMAAYRLAQRGYRVLLLEKQPLPREKPCAGGLTPKAYHLLDFDVQDLVYARADRVQVQGPGLQPFLVHDPEATIWMVRRVELDYRLALQARRQGACLQEGEALTGLEVAGSVRVRTARGEYEGRVLVGADGSESAVARLSGVRAQWRQDRCGLALETEVEVAEDRLGSTVVVDLSVPGGYAWVFPKGRLYSIGAGSFSERYFKELRGQLERFLAASKLPIVGRPTVRGRRVPVWSDRTPLHGERVVLVGDAAGVADPFFGEGISYALLSGQMAAEAIDDYLQGRQRDLATYTRRVHRTIGRDLRALGIVASVVYRMPTLSLHLLRTVPALQRLAAYVISGQWSLSGIW